MDEPVTNGHPEPEMVSGQQQDKPVAVNENFESSTDHKEDFHLPTISTLHSRKNGPSTGVANGTHDDEYEVITLSDDDEDDVADNPGKKVNHSTLNNRIFDRLVA